MKAIHAIACVAAALLAAGCGSSDNDAPAPPVTAAAEPASQIPSSALQSVAGLVSYLAGLIGAPSDTAEPVVVGTVTLPVDDTSEASP